MSDQTIIVKNQGTIFLAGPPLVKEATGEVVDAETLGGGDTHTRLSGVADYLADNDDHALALAREIVRNLGPAPVPNIALAEPRAPLYAAEDIMGIVPADAKTPMGRARGDRAHRRRFRLRRVQAALRHDAGLRLRPYRRRAGRHPRQQWRAVFRKLAEGRAFHRIVLPAQDPAFVPAEHHRLHGRLEIRGRRHRRDGAKLVAAVSTAAVPKVTVIIGGSYGAGNYGMCGRAYSPRFLWMWPNARISVMGGAQAAGVLANVKRAGIEAKGGTWSAEEEAAFKQPTLEMFERQSHPLYASARLWDDGIIDPRKTRDVVALSLRAGAQRAGRGNEIRRVQDVTCSKFDICRSRHHDRSF
jgi:3-methylcrotonyl-CoA carboxylase beta subunit